MKQSWKRIDITHRLRNTGAGLESGEVNPYAVCQRVYGSDGKLWPRMCISLHRDWRVELEAQPLTFRIGCSRKDSSKSWWEEVGIPEDLISEMVEILQEGLEICRVDKVES